MTVELDRKALRDLSYGLYIVASRDGERRNGQIINTAIQVTSDPPRVAVIIHKSNLTHELISCSGVFSVSVLEESSPMAYIGTFGFRSGRDLDKLAKAQFKEGTTGCPLVTEHALSVLEARVVQQVDLGTHTVFIGEVLYSEVLRSGRPLTYQHYHQHMKGKSPPAAPTHEGSP